MRGLDGVGVRLRGTMATFATVNVCLFRKDQLRMGGLPILGGYFFVTRNAALRASKFVRRRRKLRREGSNRRPLRGFR